MAHPSEAPTHEGAGTSGACRYPSDEPPERRPRRDEEARAEKSESERPRTPTSESAPAAASDAESLAPPRRFSGSAPPPIHLPPPPPLHLPPWLALASRLAGGEKALVDDDDACQLPARNVRADDGAVRAPVDDAPPAPSTSPSRPLPMARPPWTDAAASDATDATLGVKLARLVLVVVASSSSSDHEDPVRASPPDP